MDRIKITDNTGGGNPAEAATAPQPASSSRLARNPFVIKQGEANAPRQAEQAEGEPEPQPRQRAAPAAAEERQPNETAAEHRQRTMKLRFRHQDIEMPEEEVLKLAQKGMSAQKLEERRAQIEAQARENERRLAFVNDLEFIRTSDPQRFQRAMDVLVNGAASAAPQDSDDDGLTQAPAARTVDTALERRLAALEARNQQTERALNQRDHASRVERAIASREYLRQNPEAGEIAQELMEVALAKGEFDSVEDAAPVIEARVKRLVQGHMEAERRAQVAKREATMPRSQSVMPNMPRLDSKFTTASARGKPATRQALKDWFGQIRRAVNGTTQDI